MTEPSAYLDFAVSLRERDDLPKDKKREISHLT